MASLVNDAKQYYNYLTQINKQNNAASQANAREQMAFQERMSNTAHQREIDDLKKAGLNPVLTVGGSGGGGASSASGAMGQTDMSTASALTGYLQSLIQQQTSIAVAQTQAAATRDAAATSAAAVIKAAELQYESAQNNTNTMWGLVRVIGQKLGILDSGSSSSQIASAGAKLEKVTDWFSNLFKRENDGKTPTYKQIGDMFDLYYNLYVQKYHKAPSGIAQFLIWLQSKQASSYFGSDMMLNGIGPDGR